MKLFLYFLHFIRGTFLYIFKYCKEKKMLMISGLNKWLYIIILRQGILYRQII